MFRLSRQTKILSPALIHRRIRLRGFHDQFIPDGTGNDGTGNNGHGGQSGVFDRINRLDDKIDGSIKDHGTFKVDVIKSIAELGNELRKSITDRNAAVYKEFSELKSDQKVMKWQLHFLFFGTSSSLKDYIQLRFPAFFASEEGTPSREQPEAPQKKLQK